jgi:DNA topoisomerase-3
LFPKNAVLRITSVTGHIESLGVPNSHASWQTPVLELFDVRPAVQVESPAVSRHIHSEAKAKGLVATILFLDCDREGESICEEVVSRLPAARRKDAWRARFSSLGRAEVLRALGTLGRVDEAAAAAVSVRQELDLKIGIAFTRFLTNYFQGKYANLNATVLSYGPCQTPTLAFCVARHDEILRFRPRRYWTVDPVVTVASVGVTVRRCGGEARRIFDRAAAARQETALAKLSSLVVVSSTATTVKKRKPLPLNTVALLKLASDRLHLSPKHVMHVAERLYLNGYISYPRTESSAFPADFEYEEAVSVVEAQSHLAPLVAELRAGPGGARGRPRRDGVDAGDHPPITPTGVYHGAAGSDDARLYDAISRLFLASLMDDAVEERRTVTFGVPTTTSGAPVEGVPADARFEVKAAHLVSPGWMAALTFTLPRDDSYRDGDAGWMGEEEEEEERVSDSLAGRLATMAVGETVPVVRVKLTEGETTPPPYLSESALINKMVTHHIGTDASIAVHIQTIQDRNYVTLGAGRQLVPSKLGVTLVHGLRRVDRDLVAPGLRAAMERACDEVAERSCAPAAVLGPTLETWKGKLEVTMAKVEAMDSLFGASFEKLEATTSRLRVQCGTCLRQMVFVSRRPRRFFCATCEETYNVPDKGAIKIYMGKKCPLDGFELVLHVEAATRTVVICPRCYNEPILPGAKAGDACPRCPSDTCQFSIAKTGIFPCPDCDVGTIYLPVDPPIRLDCNMCLFQLNFPPEMHAVHRRGFCEGCGCREIEIVWHRDKRSPTGTPSFSGCLVCDDFFQDLLTAKEARFSRKALGAKGRGGGRGRGRGGRGGRGRGGGGRGRGGRGRGGGGRGR